MKSGTNSEKMFTHLRYLTAYHNKIKDVSETKDNNIKKLDAHVNLYGRLY